MMHIYQANRLECLAEPLFSVLSAPAADPLAAEVVVVPNPGMGSWLSRQVADHQGICANVSFPLPARFIWDLFRSVLPGLPAERVDGPEAMTWRLMTVLSGAHRLRLNRELDEYLSGADDSRRLALSRGLARLYDSYLVYRPQWIWKWSQGEDKQWQAELWRQMFSADNWQHWADLLRIFFDADEGQRLNRDNLPERVCLFGIDSLSPAYLEVLRRMSRYLEIHLFVLNPCAQSWDHIISESSLARHTVEEARALYLETGNSLLASMGRHARDFIGQIQELDANWTDRFADVSTDSLLGRIQSDILNLRDPVREEYSSQASSGIDESLQVHSCHSPMREVEVLYERLLDLFSRHSELEASDVAILTPSLEIYGPAIDTVFRYRRGPVQIPLARAGSDRTGLGVLARAFLTLLRLPDSHYEVNTVLGLLEQPAIRRRFQLTGDELDRIHRWVQAADIRWGIDSVRRREQGLAATTEHTWRQGLDRLMLGYALAPDALQSFAGLFPEASAEGSGARVLGRAVGFFDSVLALGTRLADDRPLAAWIAVFTDLIGEFLDPEDDQERELFDLLRGLKQIEDAAGRAGFHLPVSRAALVAHLEHHLEQTPATGRLGSGGVTVGTLAMARAIPFKVICLLGMDHDVYPSPEQPLDLDLMARRPQRGDQSRRNEDRHRFLEALLAARHMLYISYVGRSVADNSIRPPSVLVSELLDYVQNSMSSNPSAEGKERLVGADSVFTEHPLQAFSLRNFDGSDPGLFSYDSRLCEGVRQKLHSPARLPEFLSQRVPPADPSLRELTPRRLAGFLSNPARFLLRERLGIRLETSRGLLEETEPFNLAGRELRALRAMLLEAPPAAEPELVYRAAAQRGLLPHGEAGRKVFQETRMGLENLRQRIVKVQGRTLPDPLQIQWEASGFLIHETQPRVFDQGRFEYSGDAFKDVPVWIWLQWWVSHLVFNLVDTPDIPRRTECLLRDGVAVLEPPEDPETLLAGLLEIYWRGVHEPMHLFARSGLVFAETGSLDKARDCWFPAYRSAGEQTDPYLWLMFRGEDRLDAEFCELAQEVFHPLIAHREFSS